MTSLEALTLAISLVRAKQNAMQSEAGRGLFGEAVETLQALREMIAEKDAEYRRWLREDRS